eukprot:CAMPEP_0116050812 /NCGR_PEP_ID=MMETSP0322-20121206/605_1 /TAXON_ID=163516 /ORGANISM="Leptocylindrus danicus var. apora, Strain B651" /LENGTH=285 /DNA_ID=CAMNT_0003533437 /DNA_START=1832 /DNA_END=2690 /DNA_ORIENTATION=-
MELSLFCNISTDKSIGDDEDSTSLDTPPSSLPHSTHSNADPFVGIHRKHQPELWELESKSKSSPPSLPYFLHADVEVGTTNTSNNNDIPNAETTSLGNPVCEYIQLTVPTTSEGPPRQEISVEDLTPMINQNLAASGMKHGTVTVISRHTTTAITINERESRLAKDMAKYFKDLAPIDERSEAEEARAGVTYFHNDIDERPESEEEAERCRENGWDIDDPEVLQAWRNQEPINAHSHLLSMLIGSSESIPVVDGNMVIGQWQSILLVDLDGPRDRTVGLQLTGFE